MSISFSVDCKDGFARCGSLLTRHGKIDTPTFMPVGTAATVKAMMPASVKETGAQILLGNTYHLMLRPGASRIKDLGGLQKFMGWDGPILTDSGGYQVMSLSQLRKLDEDGVTFRSHIDGSYHKLTPEKSIEIQQDLGSNITMAFDECTPFPVSEEEAERSMLLSMRWAERSKQSFNDRDGFGLFGIVQGSIFESLRIQSAEKLKRIGFDGYAVGGLAVGEGHETMINVLKMTVPCLPEDKPRYLMGVGKPRDLLAAVQNGVDMFDCVLPTRSGRTGQAFTRRGEVNLRNARHASDPRPLDAECNCPACQQFSRAYLHHLVKSGEILGAMLLTWHNLRYYQDLMRGLREAIKNGLLAEFTTLFHDEQSLGDIASIK
ncbi:MAG: tRNA guanosine(34) transglycosylase Tgt [Pseudomonadota bacterium]|jgi:queuine tRNA-ribosyltransferase|nr:tRNA guanosine(34) transglycosylase Tgt [Pseudomonadota bacterium]|tara:strand:- start:5382 stop:6509 length:1128 start_codon:yes stop_codon:yes gene_type:complete